MLWVILSDLAKYSMTQSVARSLCDSWASCSSTNLVRIRQSIAASSLQSSGPSSALACTPDRRCPRWLPRPLRRYWSCWHRGSSSHRRSYVLPSVLLRSCAATFALIISHMANLSFAECCFPVAFKTAQVLPLLKKPGLDKEQKQMSSYRPISNLTTISKVIERLVLDRLRPHLLSSLNFSRLQSAYTGAGTPQRRHACREHGVHSSRRQDHRTGWPRNLGGLRRHRPRCACQPSRVTVRCCRRCLQLAIRSYLRRRQASAVRASWQTLVSYEPVRLWRTAGSNAQPAAVHCLR